MLTTKMMRFGKDGAMEEMKDTDLAVNQIFFLNGYQQSPEYHNRLAIYQIDEQGKFGKTYHYVNLDKPIKGTQQSNNIRPVSELFGIGMYYHPDRFASTEEIKQALIKADAHIELTKKKNQEADLIRSANIQKGKDLFDKHMPKGTKSVIIAEQMQNESDSMTDYFHGSSIRKVVLSFSSHTKNLFSEMRKAADKFEPTHHLGTNKGSFKATLLNSEDHNDNRNYKNCEVRDYHFDGIKTSTEFNTKAAAEDYISTLPDPPVIRIDGNEFTTRWGVVEGYSIEHKENYSGGGGYYLGTHRYSGWQINKVCINKFDLFNEDIYEAAGIEDGFMAAEAKPEKQSVNIDPQPVTAGEIQLIDYSEKAIAIVGDTKPIKDKLTALGGKWNSRLSCGAGWIFSKKKLPELQAAFGSGE